MNTNVKAAAFNKDDMIVDIQGFHLSSGKFIFKEVSFMAVKKTALPTVYLFKSPFLLSHLCQSDRNVYKWLEKYYHGLLWDDGDVPYDRLQRVFEICLKQAENIYIKRPMKAGQIKKIVPEK